MNYTETITNLDNNLKAIFTKYRSEIFDLHVQQFNDEDLKGDSCKINKISSYYFAIYLVLLIYIEVSEGYNTDWTYYKDKYKIDENRKKLACCGIDLDDILAEFELPITMEGTCVKGINTMEIEKCFIIEPTTLIPTGETVKNINTLLSNLSECNTYLN